MQEIIESIKTQVRLDTLAARCFFASLRLLLLKQPCLIHSMMQGDIELTPQLMGEINSRHRGIEAIFHRTERALRRLSSTRRRRTCTMKKATEHAARRSRARVAATTSSAKEATTRSRLQDARAPPPGLPLILTIVLLALRI